MTMKNEFIPLKNLIGCIRRWCCHKVCCIKAKYDGKNILKEMKSLTGII